MSDGVFEKADLGNNGSTSAEKQSAEVGELRTRSVAFRPQERLLHDPNVTFEEYMYYAALSRAEEDESVALRPKLGIMDVLLPSKNGGVRELKGSATSSSEAIHELNLSDPKIRATISDEEWTNASRALRTATAAACFYLITTDILGPYGVGFALGTMGWGQGFGLYTIFGACAGVSGYLLWKVFINIDSYEFPAKNYGDLAYRVYGRWFRWLVNLIQSIQLLLSVGNVIIQNGQSLTQVSKFRLCYSVCCLIWALVGYAMGQIRTLNKFTWLANWAVFINLTVMFISMGVIAHSEPNYAAAQAGGAGAALGGASIVPLDDGSYPPIKTYAGVPPSSNGFVGGLVGLMQGVYAYAGAQLFIEFLAELQRPRDFLKVMWAAQFFIYAVYMIYGSYVYYFQGQYSNSVAYYGLSSYAWQTVCNMLGVLSGLIAAVLYGNIGVKVIYNNVLIEFFDFPPLTTRRGKHIWAVVVPIYWSVAYIISAAIPYFFGLVGLTAAMFFVQFTYTFPALLGLGYIVQKEAMKGEPPFDPYTGEVQRRDSGVRRWVRGYCGKYWWACVLLTLYALGSLVVSGMGTYSSIEALIAAFKTPQAHLGELSRGRRATLQGSHPVSRGSVHIRSADPAAPPTVDPAYPSHPADVEVFAQHMLQAERIAAAAGGTLLEQPLQRRDPATDLQGDLDRAKRLVRASSVSVWHPVGACAMLPLEQHVVVDAELRVRNVGGLRVVDSNVLPLITTGNPQAAVYGIAERAADLPKTTCGVL